MTDQKNIRNFAIIAHIDHGKSTLSDRFLEITKTIAKEKLLEQFLDQNPISRQRGITIKLAPVRMEYKYPISNIQSQISNKDTDSDALEIGNLSTPLRDPAEAGKFDIGNSNYILNLIDTPGHVDFSYEVSRTLAACEGAVLLVDATQGIQAQTVAHFNEAKKEGLTMIPVINKIDLPNAQTDMVVKELTEIFGFAKEEILFISAKTGEGVEKLLQTIVEKIPAPRGSLEKPLRSLIFDAVFDAYRGVIAYIRVVDGKLSNGDIVEFFQNNVKTSVSDSGVFTPYLLSTKTLSAGEIGYLVTGVKDIRQCRVGDTIISSQFTVDGSQIEPLPGYNIPKPMVFFGMYPKTTNDLVKLKEGLSRLILNDTSLTYEDEYSSYLGTGFRVGFLGLLHAEIVKERLQQEEGVDPLLTMPQVLYKKSFGSAQDSGQSPSDPSKEQMLEPYIKLIIYTPTEYVGNVMSVCQKSKGNLLDMQYHESYAVLTYDLPYSMFIRGLSGELKSVSSGFASIDYELSDYKPADLVNLEIKINDMPIDVLSEYVYQEDAVHVAREKLKKLKETLPRQQIQQILQGCIGGTVVAREDISPYRKDVLAKMSGGDVTRKNKLLDKQKKGKSKLNQHAKITLPQEALMSLIERS